MDRAGDPQTLRHRCLDAAKISGSIEARLRTIWPGDSEFQPEHAELGIELTESWSNGVLGSKAASGSFISDSGSPVVSGCSVFGLDPFAVGDLAFVDTDGETAIGIGTRPGFIHH